MSSIVWVLGAGFSRPLGGPLLADLLLPRALDNLRYRFPEQEYQPLFAPASKAAHWIYNYGRRFEYGHVYHWDRENSGDFFWRDAEEYLDYLDTGAFRGSQSPPAQQLLQLSDRCLGSISPSAAIPRPSINELAAAGRRLLAAESSAFMLTLDMKSERCEPYIMWARQIEPSDTIITFNYDGVLDQLEDAAKTLEVVPPDGDRNPNLAPVYKLHGSVNWASQERVCKTGDPFFALKCEAYSQLAIASPGPTKQAIANRLETLWVKAEDALASADAIVFIGYRFPQTDASARRRLLRAIGKNEKQYIALHTVLGADVGSAASKRLHGLLTYAICQQERFELPRRDNPPDASPSKFVNLVTQPLYGEDFISVVGRAQITQAYRFIRDI